MGTRRIETWNVSRGVSAFARSVMMASLSAMTSLHKPEIFSVRYLVEVVVPWICRGVVSRHRWPGHGFVAYLQMTRARTDPDGRGGKSAQMRELAFLEVFRCGSRPATELADTLVEIAPKGISPVHFTPGEGRLSRSP